MTDMYFTCPSELPCLWVTEWLQTHSQWPCHGIFYIPKTTYLCVGFILSLIQRWPYRRLKTAQRWYFTTKLQPPFCELTEYKILLEGFNSCQCEAVVVPMYGACNWMVSAASIARSMCTRMDVIWFTNSNYFSICILIWWSKWVRQPRVYMYIPTLKHLTGCGTLYKENMQHGVLP